jgi:Putative transposase/Transposase zinc-binding domain
MSRSSLELATVFRKYGKQYRQKRRLPLQQLRVMRAIETCRTAALGGFVESCGQCDFQRRLYHSCRNRHCPKCQSLARAKWLVRQQAELLPIDYHHVVFTIPEPLAAIALQNPKIVYDILFRTSAQTLLTIAGDPKHLGADIGFFSILHTWGQNLLLHPHVHCVVTGGGLSPCRSRFIHSKPGFFLPVRVLSRLFRRLFLEQLLAAFESGELTFHGSLAELRSPQSFRLLLSQLARPEWVVYSKPPFGGPQQVLAYLGRYTHRIALSNDRILSLGDDGTVTFQYKDYRSTDAHRSRSMTVSGEEFIRRFLLHTVPLRFQRIRHYGILCNRQRKGNVILCRQLLEEERAVSALLPCLAAAIAVLTLPSAAKESLCPQCRKSYLRAVGLSPIRWPAVEPLDSS